MSALVVDASMALAWCFGDESDVDADAVLRHVASEGAVVPQHWSLEVANGLLTAARRGRITSADHQSIVTLLDGLPIDVDEGTSLPTRCGKRQPWRGTMALAPTTLRIWNLPRAAALGWPRSMETCASPHVRPG